MDKSSNSKSVRCNQASSNSQSCGSGETSDLSLSAAAHLAHCCTWKPANAGGRGNGFAKRAARPLFLFLDKPAAKSG